MALSFDGATKIISISSSTVLDIRDLWGRWVDWLLTGDNSKYAIAFTTVGGETVDTGVRIPVYVFLQNGWAIRPQESNHTLTVNNGILIRDGGGDPFTDTVGTFRVNVRYTQPVQAISYDAGTSGNPWDYTLSGNSDPGTFGEHVQKLLKKNQFIAIK